MTEHSAKKRIDHHRTGQLIVPNHEATSGEELSGQFNKGGSDHPYWSTLACLPGRRMALHSLRINLDQWSVRQLIAPVSQPPRLGYLRIHIFEPSASLFWLGWGARFRIQVPIAAKQEE